MARRLSGGPEDGFRTTSHDAEIAQLNWTADQCTDRDEMLAWRLAAELLSSHDMTGISLDDWPTARQFVERKLGKPILPNLI